MSDRLQKYALDRRTFIQAAGASLASCLAGAPANSQQTFAVPEVDSLTVHVIVDNATFGPFLADQSLPGLRVEHHRGSGGERISRQPLLAEFGLSLLGESRSGSETRHVLVDFGYSPEVLENNFLLLGIDPGLLDATVLSHGHLDHYGGFSALLGGRSKRNHTIPLIVGGEEAFCERVAMVGDPPPIMGALDRDELARAGLQARIATDPLVVGDHAFSTGTIPLLTFERAAIPTEMRPGVGCKASVLSPGKRDAAQLVDDGEHELATCYALKELGLVIIASCSHRGVLNSVRRAQAVSGIDKVHAVVGGFHLVRPRTEDEALRTVSEFAELDPTYIVPMHCTGEAFINEALRVMPGKIVRPYVGTRLVFDASAYA